MSERSDPRPSTAKIPPFGLRLQPDLKAQIEESAKASGRSLNAEIVARLESSFAKDAASGLVSDDSMVITIDSRGYPISWSELSAYVDAVRKLGKADPRKLSVVVITPKLADSEGRDVRYNAIEENLNQFYKRQRDKADKATQDELDHGAQNREITKKGSSGLPHTTVVTVKPKK